MLAPQLKFLLQLMQASPFSFAVSGFPTYFGLF